MKWASVILYSVLVVLMSCSDPSEIGSDFFGGGSLDVAYSDTLTLQASTVMFDSIVTNNNDRLLIGFHDDPLLGKVRASAYLTIQPNGSSSSYSLEDISSEYQRVTLTLWPDTYTFYDTLVQQKLYVHELSEEIEPDDDNQLYNTSRTPFYATPLGSGLFRPRPTSGDSVEIVLSDVLGEKIYDLATEGNTWIANTDDFIKKILKGLLVSADTTQPGVIMGFNTSAELRVYYLDHTAVPSEEKYLRFFVTTPRYNHIQTNRSQTTLKNLKELRYAVSSEETNRTVFVQGGSPLGIRIEIPHLKSIMLDHEGLAIVKATLRMYPVRDSYQEQTPLPTRLKLYAVNNRNEIYEDYSTNDKEDGFAYLLEDTDLNRDTRYVADVTEFVKSQLRLNDDNRNAMMFCLDRSTFFNTVNRASLGDQRSHYKMKLELQIAQLK